MALGACSDQIDLGTDSRYWFADFETGNLSQWQEEDGSGTSAGGQLSTLDAQLGVVSSPAPHGGRFAAESAIFAAGRQSYARLFRAGNLPNDAYFRVWMYIPARYTIKQYWNVFEFQGRSDPANPGSYVYLWSLDLQASNGEMSWYLFDDQRAVQYNPTVTTVAPIGRWFLVEAFMHQATDNSGRVTFWIDGNLLVDVTGVSTVPTMWLSWNVGGSASNITEQPAKIFLDDAEIARTGP
jgi:hypothetical protein